MSLEINSRRCKGCGICAELCPKKVLALNEVEKIEAVRLEDCIACMQCEIHCPDYAIKVIKDKGGKA